MYRALAYNTRRQLKAIASSLNRSRLARASSGSFLENLSKLIQVLAIVVGGAWVLHDYWEFKEQNNKLTNEQLQLTNKTAQLTQDSINLSNQLNQIKLKRTTEGRLNVTTESSAVRSSKFADGTFLYRFQVKVQAKNISDAKILIPAMVIEIVVGTAPTGVLQARKGFLINQPQSCREQAVSGAIKWSELATVVQRLDDIDEELEKLISGFPRTPGGLVGEIGLNESNSWNSDFVLRARPEDLAGAVITFWTKDESNPIRPFIHTRTELLSEAEDALELKAADPLAPLKPPDSAQHMDRPGTSIRPK